MYRLYAEVAVPVRPITLNACVQIELPSSSHVQTTTSTQSSQPTDEESFAQQYLATEASVYHRKSKNFSRSFLWRVLKERTCLEIQCVDTAKSASDTNEAYLTLRLFFQHNILPQGVAFADTEQTEGLTAFVLTEGRELYTFSLDNSYFRSKESIPKDLSSWCQIESPSSLTIDNPHLLYATSPYEIFISFESGRLQRLKRKSDDQPWKQDNYDDRTWGSSLRGIVSRKGHRPITFQSKHLDPLTVHGMVASPDSTHVFTICLNHTLRVWNLTTGRLVVSKDLLNETREPSQLVSLNPGEAAHVQWLKHPGQAHPMLVTYTPLDGGQFKIWEVKGGLTTPLVVQDKYPAIKLPAPDPDPSGNTLWALTGFRITPGDNSRRPEIWLLWRSNTFHRLYSLHFDWDDLSGTWKNDWSQSVPGTNRHSSPPDFSKTDLSDVTSLWLKYFLSNGRYPEEVLETALHIYQKATASRLQLSAQKSSLEQRLCSVIAANVTLRKYAEGEMDFIRFITDTDFQWRTFWRIAESINETRLAPLSLSVDHDTGMIWLMTSDDCCVVRECSNLELLHHNSSTMLSRIKDMLPQIWPYRQVNDEEETPLRRISELLDVAATLRKSFTPELASESQIALEEVLCTEATVPPSQQIIDLYQRIPIGTLVSDEAFRGLDGSLRRLAKSKSVDNDLFLALLEQFNAKNHSSESSLTSTIFGMHLVATGLRDLLTSRFQCLSSIFWLVMVVSNEMSDDDFQGVEIDASDLLPQLLQLLKESQRTMWLSSHTRTVSIPFGITTDKNIASEEHQRDHKNTRNVTILEERMGRAVRPQRVLDKPQTAMLTDLLETMESRASGQGDISSDDAAVYFECDLLVHGDIELASRFASFLPNNAWATYVKGRLALARTDYTQASHCFKRAAYTLACGRAIGNLQEISAGLISLIEADHFNDGLPKYYQHCMSMFEIAQNFSQAATFARLALKAMPPLKTDTKSSVRSEVLSRLFSHEMKCSRHLRAYDTLMQFSDEALQKSSAILLVNAIFDTGTVLSSSKDGLGSFTSLPWAMQPHLSRHIQQYLSKQAERQRGISRSSDTMSRRSSHSSHKINYVKVLSALQMSQNDFRGAVSVLYTRLQSLRKTTRARSDPSRDRDPPRIPHAHQCHDMR